MCAGAGQTPAPGRLGQLAGQRAHPALAPVDGGDGVVGPGGEHVGQPVLLAPHAQPLVLSVDFVGGQPACWHAGVQGWGEHPAGQLRLGGEAHPVDAGGASPLLVVGPGSRPVELPVDQGASAGVA